jgi:hypothetical protein
MLRLLTVLVEPPALELSSQLSNPTIATRRSVNAHRRIQEDLTDIVFHFENIADILKGMGIFSKDTRPQAEQVQMECYRSMSGEQRFRLGAEMSDTARDIALERLHSRHPDLSHEALMALYLTRILGWKLPGPSCDTQRI